VETKGSKNEEKEIGKVIKLTFKSCIFRINSKNIMEKYIYVGAFIV
jgi:hypothetical protein